MVQSDFNSKEIWKLPEILKEHPENFKNYQKINVLVNLKINKFTLAGEAIHILIENVVPCSAEFYCTFLRGLFISPVIQ